MWLLRPYRCSFKNREFRGPITYCHREGYRCDTGNYRIHREDINEYCQH